MKTSKCVRTGGKTSFRSSADADLAIIGIQANPENNQQAKLPVRSYRCRHCSGFHLTSQAEVPSTTW